MPIAPPATGTTSAQPAVSGREAFREMKREQLAAERGQDTASDRGDVPEDRKTRQPAPRDRGYREDQRTPSQPAGSTEDLDQDRQQDQADDEYEGEDGELFDDPEDGAPDEDSELDDPEENHDWRKRYSDLRAEHTRLTQERGEIASEHAEAMGETLRLKFELEDRFEEAVGRAEYFASVMSGNASQYRNINWAQVPAEQLPQLQAQAQQALAMEQQAVAAWNEVKRRKDETLTHVKQREAAIAKVRLKRTIPNWGNETYAQLRQHAVESGMDVKEFNSITNPVLIEALHAQMVMRGAGNTVQKFDKRKAKPPRGRGGSDARQPRDVKGRYDRMTVTPNQRGSFAAKAAERLRLERQGR